MISFKEFMKKQITINERAQPRKVVIDKIRNLEEIINLHLIKILAFKDDINLNHHLSDIDSWFQSIQRLEYKGTKDGNLTKELYFELLFSEPFTNKNNTKQITETISRRLKEYKELPRTELSDEEILFKIYDIQKDVSLLLSNRDLEDFKEFYLKKFKK